MPLGPPVQGSGRLLCLRRRRLRSEPSVPRCACPPSVMRLGPPVPGFPPGRRWTYPHASAWHRPPEVWGACRPGRLLFGPPVSRRHCASRLRPGAMRPGASVRGRDRPPGLRWACPTASVRHRPSEVWGACRRGRRPSEPSVRSCAWPPSAMRLRLPVPASGCSPGLRWVSPPASALHRPLDSRQWASGSTRGPRGRSYAQPPDGSSPHPPHAGRPRRPDPTAVRRPEWDRNRPTGPAPRPSASTCVRRASSERAVPSTPAARPHPPRRTPATAQP
ncbi:hypothetical protein EV567_2352 [Streptomyces sp. BK239]|nr:hypothetical protein EV567_2352 [Streptomyces sp. BK239]